jgi:hypothetical protein
LLLCQVATQGWGKEPGFGGRRGVRGNQYQLSLPVIRDTDLTGQVRREEPVNKPAERANFACLRDNRLQLVVGREDPVDFR